MMKITKKRWDIAQKNEKDFWEKDWKKNLEQNKNLSKEYWKYHKKILFNYTKISKEKKVLEIRGASPTN